MTIQRRSLLFAAPPFCLRAVGTMVCLQTSDLLVSVRLRPE